MKKTFKKEERLCNKSFLAKLFHKGSSFVVYPFRIVYLDIEKDKLPFPVAVVISVSKRRFKHANQRNRIKRVMREVYRLQKSIAFYPYVDNRSLGLLLAIQYVGKDEMSYQDLWVKMEKALTLLVNECSK